MYSLAPSCNSPNLLWKVKLLYQCIFSLLAHRAISKSYLTRQVNRSRMPLLEEIVMNCKRVMIVVNHG